MLQRKLNAFEISQKGMSGYSFEFRAHDFEKKNKN